MKARNGVCCPSGRAASRQNPRALLDDLPQEFMHEAGLADARLSDDVENLKADADRVEGTLQRLELPVAPDVARQAAFDLGVEPRRSLADSIEPISLLCVRLALDLMITEKTGVDQPLTSRRLASLMTAAPGAAKACRRAATFTVSPRTVTPASAPPCTLPTTAGPELRPMRNSGRAPCLA